MLKLMVVDDEQIVLDSVAFIVGGMGGRFELAATAKSGREAILKAEQTLPDLILMDIKMPGINGLEAIREIRLRLPGVRFIVISAYEQFEYARQSIELGVMDYVVKPLKRKVLVETLERAAAELDLEQRRRRRDLDNMEKLEKLLPVLEQGFIHAILLHRELGDEIEKYRDLFDLSARNAFMMTIEFQESAGGNAIGSGIRGQALLPVVSETLKRRQIALVGPLIVNRVVACVMEDDDANEYVQRLSAIRLAEALLDAVAEKADLSCRIGIGGLRPVHEMAASYHESVRALREAPQGGLTHIMDVRPESVPSQDATALERSLVEDLEYGGPDALERLLERAFSVLPVSNARGRNKLIEWMVMAHRIAMDNSVPEDTLLNYQTYLSELLAHADETDFQRWYVHRMLLLAERIRTARAGKTSRVVEQARRILEQEYHTELSLESISSRVNISPRYFSKLFKEETGINFIDFLTTLRINRAKELMRTTEKSIKEICYEVGYGDPNYFSRLFRNRTGTSPTEFARR